MNQKNSKYGRVLIVTSWLFFLITPGILAVTPVQPGVGLDRVAIDVNSERILVEAGQTVDVVKGDLLTVIDAWAKDKETKIEAVDFVGFAAQRSNKGRDDRGFIINTNSDLKPQFARGQDKSTFEIQVRANNAVIGAISVHVVEPRLERVELTINGKAQELRNGDTLKLRATDKIAVRHVMTNIRGNENVRHELRSVNAEKGKPAKELIFARGDHVFGRIPLQWQE